MAAHNPYPEVGRGIRKGQGLSASSKGSCESLAGELAGAGAACDYEKTVAGVRVGVRIHSAADMEALGFYGVGDSGVCGASLVVGDDALEALSDEFSGEGSEEGIGLAIARAVFGESAAPSPVRHEGISPGGFAAAADTFVLASIPEDAPVGLVEDIEFEGVKR